MNKIIWIGLLVFFAAGVQATPSKSPIILVGGYEIGNGIFTSQTFNWVFMS